MVAIRLAKLPDRTPVKVTLNVNPDLHAALAVYADLYRQAYGREESIAELIPAMLVSFLEGDKAYLRAQREGVRSPPPP